MAHGDGKRQADDKVTPPEGAIESGSTSTSGTPGSPTPPQPVWSPASQQPSWQAPPQPQGWPPAPPNWPPAPPTWPANPAPGASPSRPSRMPVLLSIVAVALIAFSSGMVVDHLTAPAAVQEKAPLANFDVYLEALKDVRNNFVARKSLTDEQLLYGSIKGLVASLGDTNHSRFMTPQEYQDLQSQLSGSVAGIGVLIVDDSGAFVVERVIRDSPAEGSGVKAGDTITAVDGASVAGLDFDGLAAKVRGAVGTQVTITVVHSGSTTPVDLTMTRADVAMPLVDWGIIPGTTIADIALYEFSGGAADQVGQAIDKATAQGATAIVLDMRGNPGGYAGEATKTDGKFLSGGVAYLEEDADGQRKEIKIDSQGSPTSLPLVVLVDADTASAAEVVAGCLKDSGRAKIVGEKTVGTGTILMPFTLSDGSVILLGVTDWLTPNGDRIFGVGIQPDTTVAMPQGAVPLDPFYFDTMTQAKIQSSGDAQLLKAIELLSR